MIKPDGVQRGLVADIIGRFEKRGYKLVALKIRLPSKALLEVRASVGWSVGPSVTRVWGEAAVDRWIPIDHRCVERAEPRP
jgi:hypothetical protein